MTCKQFVALGVRLFCIWLAIYILRTVPDYVIGASGQQKTAAAAIAVYVTLAILGLIVVLLWLFPLTVARKLLTHSAQNQPIALPESTEIERAGFCLMGLWLLTQAIPGLVYETFLFELSSRYGSTSMMPPRNYAFIVEHLVQLALAAWLLFGAKGLRRVLAWARSAGSPPVRVDSNPEE